MNTIRIKVSDYFGHMGYYAFMPSDIFNALKSAFLNRQEYADVDFCQYYQMTANYDALPYDQEQ